MHTLFFLCFALFNTGQRHGFTHYPAQYKQFSSFRWLHRESFRVMCLAQGHFYSFIHSLPRSPQLSGILTGIYSAYWSNWEIGEDLHFLMIRDAMQKRQWNKQLVNLVKLFYHTSWRWMSITASVTICVFHNKLNSTLLSHYTFDVVLIQLHL